MRIVVALVLVGCGRIAFDPLGVTDDGGPLSTALVWYPCEDDLSDGVSTDRQGTIEATCPGPAECPTRVPGRVGFACDFDGDDFLRAGSAPLQTTSAFSISVWTQADTTFGMIASKALGITGGNTWGVYLNTDVQFELWSSPTADVLLAAPFAAGTSTHIVATWDGATARLYTDGILRDEQPAVSTFDDHDVILGADENGVGPPSFNFDGRVDELQIHDHVFTQEEIDALLAQ